MKKNIAIVAGGDSSEIVISLKSADGIYSFIDKDKYNLYIAIVKRDEWAVILPSGEHTPIDKNDFSFKENGVTRHFDFAYITIHGTPGEDGRLQGYFDMIGMPYSSCGMLVSALTFNKYVCNHYLKDFGVKIAASIHLFKGETITDEEVVTRLGLPIFVKPNDGGSSFGVTKVKEVSAIQPAIAKAFGEGREVILESFIDGTEVTCGCYKVEGKEVVFPLTEVVTDNEFFDFDAKYNGQVDEITPGPYLRRVDGVDTAQDIKDLRYIGRQRTDSCGLYYSGRRGACLTGNKHDTGNDGYQLYPTASTCGGIGYKGCHDRHY